MVIKRYKLFKKFLSLTLVLFLCIENFAALVSDNDGSAFITKAEFDSLKNNFQSQIDQYNTSIDAKIDAAIAAYLSGIKADKTTELVTPYFMYKIDDGQSKPSIPWYSGTTTANVTLNQTRDVPNNREELVRYYKWNTSTNKWDYERWLGTGNWRWDTQTEFLRWKTPAKVYVPYVVCNTNSDILYFANIGTNIYNKRIAYGDSVSDALGQYTNIDQWKGQDDWYGSGSYWGARWLVGRAQTAFNGKLLTAVNPNCTNQYYYIRYGANNWANRGNLVIAIRDEMTWSREAGTLSATVLPTSGYAYHAWYWAEGQPGTAKALRDFAIAQFKEVSAYNCEQKYGVYLTTVTDDSKIELKLNLSTGGTIKISGAQNKGKANVATSIYNKSISAGDQKVTIEDVKKDTNLFITFLPTSSVGYINSITIYQTVEV
jgi:hypothetical protein